MMIVWIWERIRNKKKKIRQYNKQYHDQVVQLNSIKDMILFHDMY